MGKKIYSDLYWMKNKLSKLNVEVKYFDASLSGTMSQITAAGNFNHLTAIAQGDGQSTRDGNSIKCIGFDMRFELQQHSTPTSQIVRVVIIRQGYNDAYTPLCSDIFSDGTQIKSFRNVNESRGYKVLYDRSFMLDTLQKDGIFVKKHIPMSHHIKWDGTAGADTTFGHLWSFVVTDEATNRASVDLITRLRYVDN